MELIQMPEAMRNRGFTGWPQVYRIGRNEPTPPVGISYVIADRVDFPLVFRLMVPTLMKQHPYFDWTKVYQSLTGRRYVTQRVYTMGQSQSPEGTSHYGSSEGRCDVSLEELAADDATYVDLDMLAELSMLPTFMTDIREAIRVNVTNSFRWVDGFNKKTGVCSGYLEEQPKPRSLVILDISWSIPDGVSAGMMTLIKTITDVVNADLILTGGKSYFYSLEDVRAMDIEEERNRIPRGNESIMFRDILREHDMNYDNVITFGDSDNPGFIDLKYRPSVKNWYSFFIMERDTYGSPYTDGAGYGRWIRENNPSVNIIHNYEWAKFFNRKKY